ncbi:hypothetical protein V6Z11_D07G133500 [Gossypium hirsutum]
MFPKNRLVYRIILERQLSLAGRVTLAQSLLLFIPNNFIQSMMLPKCICAEIESLVRQFIWGAPNQKKMNLVNWGSVCQPHACDGLGFQHLEDQNASFLMKLGWVHILHSKHGMKEKMPDSIVRGRCSFLWRALAKIWLLLCENLVWSVGDGRSVWCWKHSWIPHLGPLFKQISSHGNLVPDCRLNEMVTGESPQCVRLFLWFVFKQRILTNEERVRRGIGQDPSCSFCHNELKDILHVFRDCPTTKEVWSQVVPNSKQGNFYFKNLIEWLENNLNDNLWMLNIGISWSCLIGLIVWRLWKNRNLFIFQGIPWNSSEIVKVSISWAKQYVLANMKNSFGQHVTEVGHPSIGNWCHLHTDGVVKPGAVFASAGRVVRDHNGRWILEYNHYLGECSVFDAEL